MSRCLSSSGRYRWRCFLQLHKATGQKAEVLQQTPRRPGFMAQRDIEELLNLETQRENATYRFTKYNVKWPQRGGCLDTCFCVTAEVRKQLWVLYTSKLNYARRPAAYEYVAPALTTDEGSPHRAQKRHDSHIARTTSLQPVLPSGGDYDSNKAAQARASIDNRVSLHLHVPLTSIEQGL